MPALGHDGHGSEPDRSEAAGRPAGHALAQLKELPASPGKADEPGPPIQSRADLAKYEAMLDPEDDPLSYVCANIGDTEFVVVQGRSAPSFLKADPEAGPVLKSANEDPCAGKSLVVGNK